MKKALECARGTILVALLSTALCTPSASAAATPVLAPILRHLESNPAKVTATQAEADASCRQAYASLFKKAELDIRFVFGYKDTRPARFVGDRYERLALIHQLVQPCKKGFQACGFQRSAKDADLLTKTITGPDGQPANVRVSIVHSSVSPDDLENRKDPFQDWQSRYVENWFLTGIESADVVFYNGHSRGGGGPDFMPPRLAETDVVDYDWYTLHRPGFAKILEHLPTEKKEAPGTAGGVRILGLFSCLSSKHFAQQIFEKRPDVALIGSRSLIYYTDAMANSLAALSSLLELRCQKDFKAALRHDSPREGSQIRGFFRGVQRQKAQ